MNEPKRRLWPGGDLYEREQYFQPKGEPTARGPMSEVGAHLVAHCFSGDWLLDAMPACPILISRREEPGG